MLSTDNAVVVVEKTKSRSHPGELTSNIDRVSLLQDFIPAGTSGALASDQGHATKNGTLPKELVFDNIFEKTTGATEMTRAGSPRVPIDGLTSAAGDTMTLPANEKASTFGDLTKELKNPDSIKHITDTAQELVSALRFPQHMKKLFQDAADRFAQENPGVRGSVFAGMMTSALNAVPGDHGLRVDFVGSEGMRDGNTAALLLQGDHKGNNNLIGEASIQYSNGATPQERAIIAGSLKERLPVYVNELPNRDSLDQIVSLANNLVIANGLGQDLNPIFVQGATDFSKMNPSVPGSTFARLLNSAIKMNPQPTGNLSVGFGGGDGITSGSGIVYLSDRLQDRDHTTLAEVPISFRRES